MRPTIAAQLGVSSDNAVRELRNENARLRQQLAERDRRISALETARDIAVRLAVSGAPGFNGR
jgi:hypothetical protein